MKNDRIDIRKTYKLYIGGKFVRGESGRSQAALSSKNQPIDNFCPASRKDFREAVVAARGVKDWSKASAYLRGQVLYRAAEMLENRRAELAAELTRSTGATATKAEAEVNASIDRLVYFAGWTDKYQQVFGSVNPVASSHFNFTSTEPTGVVVALAPDEPSLLALVSLVAPVILSGNAAVVLASERYPLPALTFAEILATSDLPGGVVNILSGSRAELASHFASHMDVNAIIDGSGDDDTATVLRAGSAINLKRYARRALTEKEWSSEKAEDPYWIMDSTEFKTAWHPIGV